MNVRASCVRFLHLPVLPPVGRKARSMRRVWILELACGHMTMRRRHHPPIVGEEYGCQRCELAATERGLP